MGDVISGEALLRTQAEARTALRGRCPSQGGMPVRLNVYHVGAAYVGRLVNTLLRPLGIGAFHCGVEVLGYEWSFRSKPGWKSTGVFWCHPRQCAGHAYSETIHLGWSSKTEEEVASLIEMLLLSWSAADYHRGATAATSVMNFVRSSVLAGYRAESGISQTQVQQYSAHYAALALLTWKRMWRSKSSPKRRPAR
mmetsp:Transcript_107947/g.322829  ORF Transcript_107947/g.322829 Transcript_107947/m.322829 type:complete len:195 (-) Transcript_107947:139-723(-)